MKKYNLLFLILTAILQNSCQKETITTDIDPSFEQYLIAKKIDTDGVVNGKISEKDLLGVIELNIYTYFENRSWKLTSLAGIEKMKALETLSTGNFYNFKYNVLDLPNLKSLYLYTHTIENLDLTKNLKLNTLILNDIISSDFSLKIAKENQINRLNLNYFKEIKIDFYQFNNLTQLDLFGYEGNDISMPANKTIKELRLGYYKTKNLDISKLKNLTNLEIYNSALDKLDLSKNLQLSNITIKSNKNPIIVCIAKNQVTKTLDIDSNVTIKVCE